MNRPVLLWVFFIASAFGAQAPIDIFLPDRLVKIELAPIYSDGALVSCIATATFEETVADATGVRPTIRRKKGSVQFDLAPVAIEHWRMANPPALPVNPPISGIRRTLRGSPTNPSP